MMPTSEMSHESKVMLYLIGVLNGLRDKGLVAGGHELTPYGQWVYELLIASGFKPTDDEMQSGLRLLTRRTE